MQPPPLWHGSGAVFLPQKPTPLPYLISTKETADRCAVCIPTLRAWRRIAHLVPILTKPRIAYDLRVVERFLAKGGPQRAKPGRKPDKFKEAAR
jgi:hypothetical protein